MLSTVFSKAFIAAAIAYFIPDVSAGKVTPCALGSGKDNGCSYCKDNKAIEITPWFGATSDNSFDLPEAASQTGGGYDVWWNIDEPDPTCRVIITEPYITDKGNVNSKLSGNVVLSVSHGGCYYAHVNSRGVSAAFCCGTGDCAAAGATPVANKKRELPLSRITRGLERSRTKHDSSDLDARWDGDHGNPYGNDDEPKEKKAPITCSNPPEPVGDKYTKAGLQQINGNTLSCNGGESCNMSPSMSVTASDSIMNEKSTTLSTTEGISVSMSAGFMLIGPMATVTAGITKDWTNSVTDAMAETTSNSVTKSLTLSIGLVPGANFNLWFTPTLECQSFKVTCNDVEQRIEKCSPILDGDGNPIGDHGVMTIG